MNSDTQESQQVISQNPTQPSLLIPKKSPLSKILLFILGLIIIFGFIVGGYYLSKKTTIPTPAKILKTTIPSNTPAPTPQPSSLNNSGMVSCETDADCELRSKNFSDIVSNCCLDGSSSDVIAFNTKWVNQYLVTHPVKGVCNMMCAYHPNSARYAAKCINRTCEKIASN